MEDGSLTTTPGRETVRDLLARQTSIELSFVQHRTSSVVHVIMPTDPDVEYSSEPSDEINWIGWLVGERFTLCGYIARVPLGGLGEGDKLVSRFPDDLLCRSCHRVLGPHTARAFEHPQPGDEPPDFG
jgi:hypothetical protein